jgi:hypothetical protein
MVKEKYGNKTNHVKLRYVILHCELPYFFDSKVHYFSHFEDSEIVCISHLMASKNQCQKMILND